MRGMFSRPFGLFVCLLTLGSAGWPQSAPAVPAPVAKALASTSSESQACIRCHQEQATPLVVQQWATSKHATVGIGCYECHQATKDRPDAFQHYNYRISVMVTPKVCGACHAQQTEEFEASHHAMAGEILGSLDNVLGDTIEGPQAAINGCRKCHGTTSVVPKRL